MTIEQFNNLSADDVVIHRKYLREYKVRDKFLRSKNPTTGEWFDAVTYVPLYDNQIQLFCREKESFLAEFDKKKSTSEEALDILFHKVANRK